MKKKILLAAIIALYYVPSWGQSAPQKVDIAGKSGYEISKPLISPKADKLYFVKSEVDEKGKVQQQSYEVALQNGLPSGEAKALKIQGIEEPQIAVGISANGERLYSITLKRSLKNYGQPELNLSQKKGDKYVFKQSLSLPQLGSDGEFLDVFVSQDESIILLSFKHKTKGQGEEDLYAIQRGFDGSFSKPINLGSQINGQSFEIAPMLSADNQTLFFSSDRAGKSNVYQAKRQGPSITDWSAPEALAQVNSEGFDAYLSVAPNGKAYLVSNRSGEQKAQLYSAEVKVSDRNNQGVSIDPELEKRVAKLESKPEASSSKEVAALTQKIANLEKQIKSLEEGQRNMATLSPGSMATGENVSSYEKRSIFFGLNKSSLDAPSKAVLDRVAEEMLKNPESKLILNGYTDNSGSADYNKILSERRAQSCYAYLKTKGIESERITTNWFGAQGQRLVKFEIVD